MVFNSLQFLIFFSILFIVYFAVNRFVKKNWFTQLLLLICSLYFYMCWNPWYIILILTSVLITWASGILMEDKPVLTKKWIVAFSFIINLAILCFFKYHNFFADSVNAVFAKFNIGMKIPGSNFLLPVGISFYTFQALGYTVDVYRGTVKAERNLMTYALFVTFFPQLVAGPIERTGNLLPQFKANYDFDYDRVTDGLKLVAWGMFKKVVVADQLSFYVNKVFNDIHNYPSISIFIATFFFTFQILCDFSGYTDIAIGCAKVLGFKLMKNFNKPYLATSIADFWRRWHISLSTWFKDYIYIPLGGNRCSKARNYFNLMVTFLVSGLWHGAAWHFVVWGALHGAYQVIGKITLPLRSKIKAFLHIKENSKLDTAWKVLVTFYLVMIGWVFFRANSMSDAMFALKMFFRAPVDLITTALGVVRHTISLGTGFFANITLGKSKLEFLYLFALAFAVPLSDFITRKTDGIELIKKQHWLVRWIGYYAIVAIIFYTWIMSLGSASQFIYFQF